MIETNCNYWDCECPEDYIHSKQDLNCVACGADRSDMPDSRQKEIEQHFASELKGKNKILPGDKIFSTGAWLQVQNNGELKYIGGDLTEELHYNGKIVEWDDIIGLYTE